MTERGCKVKIIDLPGLPDTKTAKGTGTENGADIFDWLMAGHTKEELISVSNEVAYWQSSETSLEKNNIYFEWQALFQGTSYELNEQGYLCKIRETREGTERVRLANFAAKIKREIFKDDGLTCQLAFEIDGILSGGRQLPEISVSSEKFSSMSWPVGCWGAAANIYPGASNKDSMRHAIQTTGFDCPKTTQFTHTGWRKINGKWIYLHGGGAIGIDGITVDLEEANLSNYRLPPITNIKEAANTTLKCLKLAPPEVTYPLLATIFLAPLCELMKQARCEPAFILWLTGATQVGKSTLTGLFLSHFGDFWGKSMPGSFKDTVNTLERKVFLLKDILFCVDDYHPVGSANEKRVMEVKAHSLIRGYGDKVARGRMNSDTSLKKSFVPRGLCIVTAEDMPNLGQSATARLFNIELQRGQINFNLLTQLQQQIHLLAQTMTGYLEWIIPKIDYLIAEYKKLFPAFRAKAAAENVYGRIPETVANLCLGMATLFSYFEDVGVISEAQKQEELTKTWNILTNLAGNQGRAVSEDSPTEQFLSALQELVTARQVIIREITDISEGGENGVEFIGWRDNSYYYLLPGLTYKVVCQFYQQQGGIFSVGEKTLWKHLEESGKIRVSKDSRQNNRTIPKDIPILGKQKKLLWLKRDATSSAEGE